MTIRRSRLWILRIGVIFLSVSAACAQDYPSKPIRIVTGGAGGGGDTVSRLIAQGISGPLGQPVVVENRGGGAIGFGDVVAKAPPDGYTVLVTGAALWVTPLLQKMPYDVVRDFAPISLLVNEVNVIGIHPSIPAKSVKELIALAKANPGNLNYSSSGVGTTNHLATELFKSMAGVNIAHIPYKSGALAITALVSGETHLVVSDAGLIMPHAKSGRLRTLAVTSAEPSVLAPGLPTVAATLPGYEAVSMTGMYTPAKTPEAIIKRLNQEIVRVLNSPDVKEKFLNARVEVVASSPEQFGVKVQSEIARMSKVIKDASIKVE